jgi:hypothetical protein
METDSLMDLMKVVGSILDSKMMWELMLLELMLWELMLWAGMSWVWELGA